MIVIMIEGREDRRAEPTGKQGTEAFDLLDVLSVASAVEQDRSAAADCLTYAVLRSSRATANTSSGLTPNRVKLV